MTSDQVATLFTDRFVALGAIDPPSFIDRVLKTVRDCLGGLVELPSKVVVLSATSESLDRAFKGIDTPGPDVIVEPALKALILGAVGFAYDALAKESAV